MELGILNGFVVAFISFSVVLYRNQSKKNLNFADWFVLSLGFFYGIGQCIVFWVISAKGLDDSNLLFALNWDNNAALSHLLAVAITIGAIYVGYEFVRVVFKKSEHEKDFKHFKMISISTNNLRLIACLFFIVGVVAHLLYSRAHGGVMGVLENAAHIRVEIVKVENTWSFLKRLSPFTILASFIYFGIVMDRKNIKVIWSDWFFLVASILFSLFLLLSWAGRVGFVVYVLTFFLGHVIYKSSHRTESILPKITLFSLASCLIIPIIGKLTLRRELSFQIEYFGRDLIFPFVSWSNHIDAGSNFRWFKDIALAPVYLFPEKLWGGWIGELSNAYNIRVILVSYYIGGIPHDFLTFSYLQAGWFGIVLYPLMWGGILCMIEKYLIKFERKGLKAVLYANFLLYLPILSVPYADPKHIVRRMFYLIVGVFVLNMFRRTYRSQPI